MQTDDAELQAGYIMPYSARSVYNKLRIDNTYH